MTDGGGPLPDLVAPLGVLAEIDEVGIKLAAIRASLELDVFSMIGSGLRDAEGIALATGSAPEGMRVLLEALGSFGLLRRSGDRYEPTPTAAAYLTPGSPTYVADYYLSEMRARDHFTESVRLGRPARDVRASDGARLWVAIALWSLVDWPTSLPLIRSRWAGLGITPASLPGVRVLDVGCGSGIDSLALAAYDPSASVTGIDSRPVLEVAERLANAMGVARQAAFVPGDATALNGLAGPFDVILFGAVLHYLEPSEIAAILLECRRLLHPTGRLVIVAPLLTPGDYADPEPFLTAVWMLNVAPRGRVYGVDDYAAMLVEAGFDVPTRLEDGPWLQSRPVT